MPSNQNLINNLIATQSSNNTAVGIVSAGIPPTQAEIDLITPVCVDIDEQILTRVNEIQALQLQIVNWHDEARAVGCGTTAIGGGATVGLTTQYPTVVRNRSQNINSATYTGTNPFNDGTAILITTAGAVGVGTLTVLTQNDSSLGPVGGAGSIYDDLSACYTLLGSCSVPVCTGYANSVTTANTRITTLVNEINDLIADTNVLKAERKELETIRYGSLFILGQLEERNVAIGSVTTTIQEYSSND